MMDRIVVDGLEIVLDGRTRQPLGRRGVVALILFLEQPGKLVTDQMVAAGLRKKGMAGTNRAVTEVMDDVLRAFGSLQLISCWSRKDHMGWVYTPPAEPRTPGGSGRWSGEWTRATPVASRARRWLVPKYDFPMPDFPLIREVDRTLY